jgi:putative oxidoreductase
MNNEKLQAAAQLLGRIMLAAIFLWSGWGKFNAAEATQAFIAKVGMPMPVLAYYAAVAIELAGGIALIVGFKTRWAAAFLAIYTLVAALYFHANFEDRNQLIHFMKNIAIVGGFLQLVVLGGGCLSLDSRRERDDQALL